MISGEYLVLDGAKALALPTKLGQSLKIYPNADSLLNWKSYNHIGDIWFDSSFKKLENGLIEPLINDEIANRLAKILNTAKSLNPDFLSSSLGLNIESHLEFPNDWGLGSSSTLIRNISDWADVDAYKLLQSSFGGSGYDIACASSNKAITYQLLDKNKREILEVDFSPVFSEQIFFVYLNQKQNSREGIAQYRANKANKTDAIQSINQITAAMIECTSLTGFQKLIDKHEKLISEIIDLGPIKEKLFSDFNGSIKSLGAWGGDFVMVASKDNPTAYFQSKGFETVIRFENMVLG